MVFVNLIIIIIVFLHPPPCCPAPGLHGYPCGWRNCNFFTSSDLESPFRCRPNSSTPPPDSHSPYSKWMIRPINYVYGSCSHSKKNFPAIYFYSFLLTREILPSIGDNDLPPATRGLGTTRQQSINQYLLYSWPMKTKRRRRANCTRTVFSVLLLATTNL